MSQVIQEETLFFLSAVLTGILLVASYDILRIFRRVVKHGAIWVGFEDFLYFCSCALVIFYVIYKKNNGAIRGYALVGIILGVFLYHESISEFLVKTISRGLNVILRLFLRFFDKIRQPFCRINKYLKCFLLKPLNSLRKRVRMKANKYSCRKKSGDQYDGRKKKRKQS